MLNNSLDYLNPDTSLFLCSHLNINELIALNSASHHWKNISDVILKVLKPQIFEDRFGAIASHEAEVSYETLATRIHFTMKLGQDEVKENLLNGKFQVIFEDRIPYVKPADKNSQTADVSANANAQLRKIYAEHIKILNDLYHRPINIKKPLQDYRNRLIRHKTIIQERALLSKVVIRPEVKTLPSNWNYLGYLGVVVDLICKIFMKLISFICPGQLKEPAEVTYDLSEYLDSAIPHSNGIEVGSFEKNLSGQLREFKIVITPSIIAYEKLYKHPLRYENAAITGHELVEEERIEVSLIDPLIPNYILGGLHIKRFSNYTKNASEWEFSDEILEPHLEIIYTGCHTQDKKMQLEVRKIMIQIAMEIFDKDPLKYLHLWSDFCNPSHYLLWGFQCDNKLPLEVNQIRNFYNKHKTLPRMVRKNTFYSISKCNNHAAASETNFVNRNNEKIEPAYATLEPNTPPIAWEKVINENRFLNPACESFLWKFYEKNSAK